MKELTLQVEGMACDHCVKSIEKGLGQLNGINTVNVILDSKTVNVTYDEQVITEVEIKNEIEDLGYDVIG